MEHEKLSNEQRVDQLRELIQSKGFHHYTGKLDIETGDKGRHEVDILSSWRGDFVIVKYKDDRGELYGFNVLTSYRRQKATRSFEEVMEDLESELADLHTIDN